MKTMSRFWQRISEMQSSIWKPWGPWTRGGLRSTFRYIGLKFFGDGPAYENTLIKYDLARQLYRHDGCDNNLGTHFARPLVDLQVDFMGQRTATVQDEELDDVLNKSVR